MLLATLALSGFFWALPMRHNAVLSAHDFEARYYVGVPLVFYSLLLLYVHKRWGSRLMVSLAVAALLAFVVSAVQMDHLWRIDAQVAETQQATLAELGSIRETTRGKVVLFLASVKPDWFWWVWQRYEWRYYPVGSVLTHSPDLEAATRAADFILTRDRVESDALLTPGNEQMFLYGSAGIDDLVELYRATYQRVISGEPAARSYFDVYLSDRTLFYVKDPCVGEDVGYTIFVRLVPEDLKDLPRRARLYGFGKAGVFPFFRSRGVRFEGKCMAIIPLPDYPTSLVRTGQRPDPHPRGEGYRGWTVEIPASP